MSLLPKLDELLELRHLAHAIGLGSRQRVNSQLGGNYAARFHGRGMEFSEVRAYRQGDDLGNIDWRVTARTGEPHLKIFQEERQREVILCVDRGPGMHFGTRGTFKLVQAARVAALLGWSAHGHNDRVGGLLFGDAHRKPHYFRPRADARGLWQLLKALSTSPDASHAPDAGVLDETLGILQRTAKTGALVFLIADFAPLHRNLRHRLLQLRQHHQVVLIAIDDEADYHLPDMGLLHLGSADGRRLLLNSSHAKARERYRREWRQRREELLRWTGGLGISLLPIRTDENPHQVLLGNRRLAGPRTRHAP